MNDVYRRYTIKELVRINAQIRKFERYIVFKLKYSNISTFI